MTKLIQVCLYTILSIFFLTGCSQESVNGIPTRTIGIQVSPAMGLVMVAKDEGFFEKNGVDIVVKEFTAGKFALQAYLSRGIDYAVSGEVPVALALMQGHDMTVVSQVVERTINEVRVVALRDGNKTTPTEYFQSQKRKVATSFGGGPEFFTYSFFKDLGIEESAVQILSQKPEDMPPALATKSVDAIAIFDPFAFIAESQLGEEVITFTNSDLYSELYVFVARARQLKDDQEVIQAITKALYEASRYMKAYPEQSKAIVNKYTKLDPAVIDGIWGSFVFEPALTEQLIDYWDAQYDWAIATGKIVEDTVRPDFRGSVDSNFLEKVNPNLVNMSSPGSD